MRVGTGLTGVVLVLLGGAALCLGLGVFGPEPAGSPVVSDGMSRFIAAHDWFWPLVVLGSFVVAAVGLAWLVSQARAAVVRRRAFVDGATRMLARASARGLVEDARRHPGVQGVRVRLTGTIARPRLVMTVVCAEDADLPEIYTGLGDGPVERYRTSMGMPDLPVIIRFKVVYRETRVA